MPQRHDEKDDYSAGSELLSPFSEHKKQRRQTAIRRQSTMLAFTALASESDDIDADANLVADQHVSSAFTVRR